MSYILRTLTLREHIEHFHSSKKKYADVQEAKMAFVAKVNAILIDNKESEVTEARHWYRRIEYKCLAGDMLTKIWIEGLK